MTSTKTPSSPLKLPGPVVAGSWLAEHLGSPGLVVLDGSWYLSSAGRDARSEYLEGHVPTARFFDVDACCDHTSDLPQTVPTPEGFSAFVEALGIENSSAVVIYDGSGKNLSAPRVWWMFRYFGHNEVAVLDGGSTAWKSDGRPTEQGESFRSLEVRPPFLSNPQPSLIRNQNDVVQASQLASKQIVDMRPTGRFEGTTPEPRPGLRRGHIAGSRCMPFTQLVDPDTALVLPLGYLRELLVEAGVDPDAPVIGTCGSGTSACSLALNLARLGNYEVAIYDGSWSEWGQQDGPRVVEGPAEKSTL